MSDTPTAVGAVGADARLPGSDVCARCGRALTTEDRVEADDRSFCRACWETLRQELSSAIAAMSADVPYARAAVGAVLGATVGALLWWGFTVVTHLALGLVAVAIGFLTGLGAVRFAGGKRSRGLQVLSVVVAVAAFGIASYLVNMSLVNQQLAKEGAAWRVGFPPPSLATFFDVVKLGFGVMDLVFLAIVIWEAFRIPKPPTLPA